MTLPYKMVLSKTTICTHNTPGGFSRRVLLYLSYFRLNFFA